MPAPFVCVLHSSSGFYSESLVGNALQCLHAIQHTIRANAPDFIPSVAVFLADLLGGARCIYSSVLPDRNHALDRVAATYPPLADASGNVFAFDDAVGDNQAARTTAFAQLFRLRSPQLLQQSVLQAVQRQNATVLASGDVAREGIADAASSPTSHIFPTADGDTVWGSLAGALLASLCYLRAHSGTPFSTAEVGEADVDAEDAASRSEGHASAEGVRPSSTAGRILLFSDAEADAVPSYSAECALAVAAVTASKMDVVVSCFGAAATQSDSCENRLTALASSLGGFCAARFHLADLGQLLDGDRGVAERGGGGRSRQKRDRIASQFVVGPTMLPRVSVASSRQGETHNGGGVKRERGEAGAGKDAPAGERASHLGWLCPSCMAILYRGPQELLESSSRLTEQRMGESSNGQNVCVTCPYCYEK